MLGENGADANKGVEHSDELATEFKRLVSYELT